MILSPVFKPIGWPQPWKIAAALMVAGALVFDSGSFAQPADTTATAAEKPATDKPAAETSPTATPVAKRSPDSLEYVEGEEYSAYSDIQEVAPSDLVEAKYDVLEKQADEYRKSKQCIVTGEWKLTTFYEAVGGFDRGVRPEGTIEDLRKWVAERPTSITARVALAQALVNYAWVARGHGTIDTASPEQMQLFEKRLQEARLVLRDAKKLPEKCPHWWAVAQVVALGQGWDRKTYDGLFNEAIAFEPNYNLYYFNKSKYLLGRWYGETGDPEAAAMEAADYLAKQQSPEAGDILYARIFWFLDRMHAREIEHGLPTVSYARMAKGFEALLKAYPDNIAVKTQWAQQIGLSWQKPNMEERRAKARQLLNEVDYRVDIWAFHNKEEFMALYRAIFKD